MSYSIEEKMSDKEKVRLKNRIKKGMGCLFLAGCVGFMPSAVMAAKKAEPPKEFSVKLDGFEAGEDAKEELLPQIDYDKETEQLHLSVSTEGQKEGQYPLSFFQDTKKDLKGYGGVVLSLVNEQAEELKMNMLLAPQEGGASVVADGEKVVLKEDEIWQETTADLGCFTIPADFDGQIYLPFDIFEQAEEIDGIYGLGFTFVLPEDDTAQVTLEAIQILPDADMQALNWFEVNGADTVLRPTVGESIADYITAFYNMAGTELKKNEAVTYEIQTEDGSAPEGMSIDENGRLTVKNDAVDGAYLLFARDASGQAFRRTITLKGSWTETQKTENGYDASMLPTDRVTEVVAEDSPFMDASLIRAVRVAAVAIIVVFLGHYAYKHRKYKKEFVDAYYKGEK